MNLSTLIKQYFSSISDDITIDVFDEKNIYDVYQRVVGVLTQHIDIETTVLQEMSYCFYEILDNVLTHSGKELGTVLTHYDSSNHILSFLVADDGIGVQASLSENVEYANNYPVIEEYRTRYMELCEEYAKTYLDTNRFEEFNNQFVYSNKDINKGGSNNMTFGNYAKNKLATLEN